MSSKLNAKCMKLVINKRKILLWKGYSQRILNIQTSKAMRKNIQIAVPKPCDEKWGSFTKTSQGSFCFSCQKEIVDFTSWSDERIKAYFRNLKGSTCGRFREDQLKAYSYGNRSRAGMSWIAVVFAGFLLLFSSRNVSVQTVPKQKTEQYQSEEKKENIRKVPPATVTIIGTVTSREDGQAMSGVKVVLKGTSTETLSNVDGKFALDLPNKDSTQFIVFSFKGFKTVDYMHNVTRPGREIAVDMTHHDLVNVQNILAGRMGGVMVSRWYEPKEIAQDVWWWLTGR